VSERIRLRLAGDHGFAVLEVMIVVSVLGLALAVGVPSYLGLRGGSADGKTKESLRAALPAAEAYYADHHRSYRGLDSTDLLRIDPRISLTVSVTSARKRSYCLTENVNGKTWSVKGPNPAAMTDPSSTKGWFEGESCR
jgi:prepilin-type N-terminal cleavage/methylation domain-containing protein